MMACRHKSSDFGHVIPKINQLSYRTTKTDDPSSQFSWDRWTYINEITDQILRSVPLRIRVSEWNNCRRIACWGPDNVVGIVTRYGARRSGDGIPEGGGARFSPPVQTGPGDHPASCTISTGTFPGVKRPRCGANHPTTSSAPANERLGLYLYSLLGLRPV
jgi:hypothetical protein